MWVARTRSVPCGGTTSRTPRVSQTSGPLDDDSPFSHVGAKSHPEHLRADLTNVLDEVILQKNCLRLIVIIILVMLLKAFAFKRIQHCDISPVFSGMKWTLEIAAVRVLFCSTVKKTLTSPYRFDLCGGQQ